MISRLIPLILLLLLPFPAGSTAAYSEQPLFDRTEYQIGSMPEGKIHVFRFALKNATPNPLSVLSVNPTCVYIDAEADRVDLAPQEGTVMTIHVDARGNLGRIAKTIEIMTTASPQPHVLTLRGTIVHTDYDRSNPQALFKQPCSTCHVGGNVQAKSGESLYDALCFSCHKDGKNFVSRKRQAMESAISLGVPGTAMPAFSVPSGGPLSAAQIRSLVDLLSQNTAGRL